MRKLLGLVLFLLALATDAPLKAHQVQYQVGQGGVVVEVWYEGVPPVPMKGAYVKVFPPEVGEEFQKGRTDARGRFCFFPDRKGKWEVLVNDGQGHGATVEVLVDEGLRLKTSGQRAMPISLKLAVGLSLIFGLFGVLSLFWGRQRRNWRRKNG